MSRRVQSRCPHCFETVPYAGPQMMPIDIVEPPSANWGRPTLVTHYGSRRWP